MAETAAELTVDVSAKETVSAVLARLESQLDRTNTSVEKIAAGMGARLGGAQQKAANDALSHAQAQSRLQVASGNTAGAIRTMQEALQSLPAGTTAAIRAETQLVQLQTKLAKETQGTSAFVDAFKQGLFGFVAPAAVASAALGALQATVQSFVDAFNFKANLDATTASIKSQLNGFRDVNATYNEAIAFGRQYNITQQQTNDILSSSTDILRSSKSSVSQLETALIRLQSRDVSKPISEASRALRELSSGDVTSIKELFNVPAKDALKMRDAILAGGDAVQVLLAWLDKNQVGVAALDQRLQGARGRINELEVAQEDLTKAQAAWAEGPGLTILEGKIRLISGATRLLNGDFDAMGQSAKNTGVELASQSAGFLAYVTALASGKSAAEATAAANDAVAASVNNLTQAQTNGGGGSWEMANGLTAEQNAANAAAEAIRQVAAEHQAAADKILAMVSANQSGAQASVLAAAQQQAQAAEVKKLTDETNKEVSAFLALNPTIDASGIAAQVAAGKIPALIGQLAALRVEAYSTRDAVAALAAAQGLQVKSNLTAAGLGINAPGLTSGKNNSVDAVVALQNANAKAADEQIKGDLAIAKAKGDTAAQVALLRKQQQGLNKDSLQYKQIEADIIGLQKGKKGGGAGGTKLSDQQKLNNQLQANQDAADNKSEYAERQHQQRMLDIEADFQKKQREQLAANEISKRQSQADFYDKLTSSELNKKKGGSAALQKIDADYQAAYQKSQELAQAGNAKLAADYLALKQKQADQELAYEEAKAKATEEKDKAEISRLEAIHKLRQQANAEEEKQLLAGGDANVNAKNQALADEAANYARSQDKIGTAADRAADRQIAAAQRAGKVIDEQALKVDKLGRSYDRIAPGAGQATPNGTPAGQTTTPATDQTTSTPQAPADIVAAVNAAKDAIVSALAAVERAEKDTGRALRSASNTGGIAG
jgi:hypothetical protein